jgi:hypothetical protein
MMKMANPETRIVHRDEVASPFAVCAALFSGLRSRLQPGGGMPRNGLSCATCRFFRCDPREIESAIAGLRSFGSGYAAVRASDGLCEKHGRYLAASACCELHQAIAHEPA